MMMMVMSTAADGLRQVRDVGELAALRSVGKIGRQLVELRGRRRIAIRGRGLGRSVQVGGDLLRYLLVFGWVRLLQLLQRAHQLGERRKLAVVRLLGRSRTYASAGRGSAGRRAGSLKGAPEKRLQVSIVQKIEGTGTHNNLIGIFVAFFYKS
jgi:hypothetical protein